MLKLRAESMSSTMDPLPDGITLIELNQRLADWIRFHTPCFVGATVYCLDFASNIQNLHTKVLLIKLRPRERKVHKNVPGMYFEFVDACAVDMQEAMGWEAPWPYLMMGLRKMQMDSEREGRGGVTAALIEAKPLDVQAVPLTEFGTGTAKYTNEPNWKPMLKQYINTGTRPFALHGRPR